MFMFDGWEIAGAHEENDDEEEEEFLPWTGAGAQQSINPGDSFGFAGTNNNLALGASGANMDFGEEFGVTVGSLGGGGGGGGGADGDETVPQMPEEFYSGVEMFLSRSPPRLKSKKRMEVESAPSIVGRTNNIGGVGKQPSASKSGAPRVNVSTLHGNSNSNSNSNNGKRVIDVNLLSEAFAYTDKILREAVLEEAQEASSSSNSNSNLKQVAGQARGKSGGTTKPRSAGSVLEKSLSAAYGGGNPKSAPSGGGGGSGKSGSSSARDRAGAGLVKRLRQSTQQQAGGVAMLAGAGGGGWQRSDIDFSVVAVSEDDSAGRKLHDFDALVANFQNGVTLRKLQAELAASQQSMKKSEAMFKELAGKSDMRR